MQTRKNQIATLFVSLCFVIATYYSVKLFRPIAEKSPINDQTLVGNEVTTVSPSVQEPSFALERENNVVTPAPSKSTKKPTPTVTQAVINAQPLTFSKGNTITSTAGNISTLSSSVIEAEKVYKIDMSSYNTDSFVLMWPKNVTLYWQYVENGKLLDKTPVPLDDDGKDAGETNSYSGILQVPAAKYFYLISSKQIDTVKLSLINPVDKVSAPVRLAGVYNSDSGASYTSLPLVTRDSWGANPSNWDGNSSKGIDDPARYIWYPVYYTTARIVIHHTATTPNYQNPSSAVRAIYLYHAYIRKWGDIGYNFIIDQNGTVYEGKGGGADSQGYHAFGAANRISIGISVIGDYSYSAPSSGVRSSLVKLLAEKADFYGFSLRYSNGGEAKWKDIGYTVFGHRDTYKWNTTSTGGYWESEATACPGTAFENQLSTITRDAESYRKTNFAQIREVTSAVNEAFRWPHEQGTLIVKYDVPDDTPTEVIRSYLPAFSGITNYTIAGNIVTFHFESSIVVHPYYGDSEYLIPPMGWTGYSGEYNTFTVPLVIDGPENRAKTMMKIFRLDPRVKTVDLKHTLAIQN